MKQLATNYGNSFFTKDNSILINCEVGKSSPMRKGEVISVLPFINGGKELLKAEVKFRDSVENIVVYYK